MEYESTILKRLIETYGVVGNPRYISEIIKEFIVRGKELYPQLFTYQSDWLAHIDEFGLTPDYVVSYTGQQIYAPHTKERPVKSAILKGQTLVNDRGNAVSPTDWTTTDNVEYVVSSNNTFLNFECSLQPNSRYLMIFNAEFNGYGVQYGTRPANGGWDEAYSSSTDGQNKQIINTTSNSKWLSFIVPNNYTVTKQVKISHVMIIHYQDGMENWDIPYFEGMQSVKMPVLTTSNEDGTKTNILTVNEDVTLRGVGDVQDTLDCLTGEVTERIGELKVDLSKSSQYGIATDGIGHDYFVATFPDMERPNGVAGLLPTSAVANILPVYNPWDVVSYRCCGVYQDKLRIYFPDFTTEEQYVEWLSSNELVIHYQLETESIKTVDLNILDQNGQSVKQLMSFNGGTHFTTSSQEGSLLPTIRVDVVTDLEKTLKVCSLEGNTL